MEELRLQISRHGRSDLLRLLDEKGVKYVERYPLPGTIIATSEFVDILNAIGGLPFAAVASVLVAWLGRNAFCRLIVRKLDNGIVHIELSGHTAAELENLIPKIEGLLREAAAVNIIQMKKDDDELTTR